MLQMLFKAFFVLGVVPPVAASARAADMHVQALHNSMNYEIRPAHDLNYQKLDRSIDYKVECTVGTYSYNPEGI